LQFRLPMGVELVEGKSSHKQNERQRTKDDDNRVAPGQGEFRGRRHRGSDGKRAGHRPRAVVAPGRGRCGHGAVKSGQSIISR
jgi:hypothetical protein